MPIETICQGCGKRLRVGDEHAGKAARCPHCQTIYTVPQPATSAALGAGFTSNSPLPASERWHLKTDGGLTFGPVTRPELDRWLAEGRITPGSQVLHEGDGQWIWAGKIYPQLAAFAPTSNPFADTAKNPNPFADVGANPNPNPYAPASPAGYGYAYYREQHRGPAVLALSLLGLVCIICPIIALAMGMIDLDKMKRGTMDPAGRGLTIAGLVISWIFVGMTVLYIFAVILSAAMN